MQLFPLRHPVSCATRFDTLSSVARVKESYYLMTGTWCTDPEALAACYSVPDGAPADMAAINDGVWLSDEAAAHHEAQRAPYYRIFR